MVWDTGAGATRSATCIALEGGALLTQVSRELFMHFIASRPRTLQIYLHKVHTCLYTSKDAGLGISQSPYSGASVLHASVAALQHALIDTDF